jgi:hypothetical protein
MLDLRECDSVWLPSGKIAASIEHELKSWKQILGHRVETATPSILRLVLSIYGLPKGSSQFVKDACNRWS